MSKLAKHDRFIDLSDYGRPLALVISKAVQYTRITPIHLTILFAISGLLAIYCMLEGRYVLSTLFLVMKSVLDAADGELSRLKNTPSHTGRYLDSIFDLILNLLIILTIAHISNTGLEITILAFLCVQLQGTLYNYYYVILRNKLKGGDGTSRIFENKPPRALSGESQKTVNALFLVFYFMYSLFDKCVYLLDPEALKVRSLPGWFMTMVSVYGLGFQLLIIGIMLSLGYVDYVIPFFIYYTLLLFSFVTIRKKWL